MTDVDGAITESVVFLLYSVSVKTRKFPGERLGSAQTRKGSRTL